MVLGSVSILKYPIFNNSLTLVWVRLQRQGTGPATGPRSLPSLPRLILIPVTALLLFSVFGWTICTLNPRKISCLGPMPFFNSAFPSFRHSVLSLQVLIFTVAALTVCSPITPYSLPWRASVSFLPRPLGHTGSVPVTWPGRPSRTTKFAITLATGFPIHHSFLSHTFVTCYCPPFSADRPKQVTYAYSTYPFPFLLCSPLLLLC